MDEVEKEINRKTWWIMGIVLLVLILGGGGYYIWLQRQQLQELNEMHELEKERLMDAFEEVSFQFEGNKFYITNDSLLILYNIEQEKVQRLQEELRTTKSTNVRRINELNKELETLRKIMYNYIEQIDSLNRENIKLRDENAQVTQRLQQANSRATTLAREKEVLTERVQLASRLEAANIQVSLLGRNGRVARNIRNATQLKLTFVIPKNITAPVGEQTIYVRLMKPDDDILKKLNYGHFRFENRDLEYSMKRMIVYDGEEQTVEMYWDIEEYLSPGTYRADIFAEGNSIGRRTFEL
jgi:hypothetical protein